jgi:DNA repair photolyase
MKTFNGKAIYNPSGKAGEYSYWACNFYVGCSNGCTYCYCKKGILAGAMGQDKPQLKKCFKDEKHALEVFEKELLQNKTELQKHGIFFSFTTDPMLEETQDLTYEATSIAIANNVPVKILTKTTYGLTFLNRDCSLKHLIAFGFTLTGHDELEPKASTNAERIKAMKKLHELGFKTFASIEPIIDFERSMDMIADIRGLCDLYKIGLESGKKYNYGELKSFIDWCCLNCNIYGGKIYFKDSILKQAGINREDLPANCVNRDYRLHEAPVHVA